MNQLSPISSYTISSGSAYVYIPADMVRNTFVRNCCKSLTISILTVEGSRFDDVPVSVSIFDHIRFPENSGETGSLLFYAINDKKNYPFVVGVIPTKNEYYNKNENIVSQQIGDISILWDGNSGSVNYSIPSSLNISVLNGSSSESIYGNKSVYSKTLTLSSQQSLLIEVKDSKERLSIQYDEGSFTIVDQNNNAILMDGDGVVLSREEGSFELDKNGKFSMKNGQYSLTDLFNDFISEVSNITVATAIGTQPVINKATILAIKNKLKNILK